MSSLLSNSMKISLCLFTYFLAASDTTLHSVPFETFSLVLVTYILLGFLGPLITPGWFLVREPYPLNAGVPLALPGHFSQPLFPLGNFKHSQSISYIQVEDPQIYPVVQTSLQTTTLTYTIGS